MRKLFTAILALAGASSLLIPARQVAYADEVQQEMIPDRQDVTRAARLRTSIDPGDPDTVWIGHIYDPTFSAGGKMTAGGYGPYHVGRGPNFPTKSGGTIGDNGTWDFDRFQPTDNDSLQGWWPICRPYQSGASLQDYQRSFFCFDYGNQVNYVINQGSPKRTFGVVGLWHRDRGNTAFAPSDTMPGTNVQPVLWSPTEVGGAGSNASAWMGLRSHGDLSAVDLASNGGTGNPFNASLFQYQGNNAFNAAGSLSTNGTDHNFPGYGSQMDQMLYRDVVLAEGDGLNISFNFSTNMSTGKNTTNPQTAGWFDKDPISNSQIGIGTTTPQSNDGNFISADAAGANAPADSFMVYVGAPVNDNNVTFSAPLTVGGSDITTVYDKKRRWFSEVIKLAGNCVPNSGCPIIGKEIASYAFLHPPTNVTCDFGTLYGTVLKQIKDADGNTSNGGRVRIVFRVKTNRGFDDEAGGNTAGAAFNSGTRGAAIVDNVVVNGWAAGNGDFEAPDAINNDTAVDATAAWKSTGKPPAVYFHAHSISGIGALTFVDPCGSVDSPLRLCNMYGKVIASGDHDASEKDGGLFGSNSQDRARWFVSPTVNLKASGNGPGNYNGMGIDQEIATTDQDYRVIFSLYNAGFVNATSQTGNFMAVGWQSYPARQANGNICWGEVRHTTAISFYGPPQACFETFFTNAKANQLIRTTNAANRPDSLRVYIMRLSRCYTFTNLVEATCSPTDGVLVGTYYDNISIALQDGAPPPEISFQIWNLINDAFPANGNDALIPASFDTCAAQVRIGLNNATNIGSPARNCITGDSVLAVAGGANTRMDMIFRIKPGPGNYATIGHPETGIRKRPDQVAVATSGDGTFFGTYMSSPGEFSKGTHAGGWNADTWNSARIDTAENNLFPTASNSSAVALTNGTWSATYIESDPKYPVLGISHFICTMTIPSGLANSLNIKCDGTNWGAYGVGSGYNGVTTSREHTKIIPDGMLTPGSHVEYFFRKSDATTGALIGIAPDTNFVIQGSEGSTDGHRWQEFSVLPDRWKDGAWAANVQDATAPACMLYVDWADRRGNERVWVGIADSIGATRAERYGAHNGWHARGDQIITGGAVGTDPTIAVYKHGGQPGTIWDMFGIKASESSTTSGSFASRTTTDPTGLRTGKKTLNGPSGLMLRQYYRILLILTGDLSTGNIGPYTDKGDNDVGLLADFASAAQGTSKPRAIWAQGTDLVEGQTDPTSGHPTFTPLQFGAGLVDGDYRSFATDFRDTTDLVPNAPISTNGSKYSTFNNCQLTIDVLSTQPSGPFVPVVAGKYVNPTTGATQGAGQGSSIYGPSTSPNTTHEAITLIEGFDVANLGTWKTMTSQGTINYYYNVFSNLFASLNCTLSGSGPVSVGENPNNALVYFLALRSENPMRSGMAAISFGITRKERVELKVYDVTGRLVKTLANREFDPAQGSPVGQFTIHWDGSNDEGQKVARGVYFYQLRTPSFVSQRKLAVLNN